MKPASRLWWNRPETRDSLCKRYAAELITEGRKNHEALRFYWIYSKSPDHRDAPAVALLRQALKRAKISTAVPRGMVACPKCGVVYRKGETCPNFREGGPT